MDIPQTIGRYQVQRLLGYGGMAVVFLARDPFMDRLVAVKVLPRQLTFNDDLRQRFYREARIIAALEHPAIVPIHDFGEHEQQPYLVMRYMAGGSLRNRLEQPLSLRDTYAIFERLAPALDKAHERGVIHRDLKPDNVLFDEDGLPYLADFGVARLADATQTMTVVGTPSFMSPEQIQGNQTLDGRCDIYALGIMLYLMLSGEPPFKADTPPKLMFKHVYEPVPDIRARRADLPPDIQPIVERALAKDADERYNTAGELARALRQLVGTAVANDALEVDRTPTAQLEPAPTPDPTTTGRQTETRDGRPTRKRRTPFWIWPALAMLGLALVFWGGNTLLGEVSHPTATPPAVAVASKTTPSPTPNPAIRPSNPQLGDIWMRSTDDMVMVYVPEGNFRMGSPTNALGMDSDEAPRHVVTLDAFWIDRTEVSNEQYGLCVRDGTCETPAYAGDERFNNDQFPVVGVSWHDANTYCNWTDARLPSEAQWEYAARGDREFLYPWGDVGPSCEAVQYADCAGLMVAVDALPQGASSFAALNMAGNVWEWVNDWYDSSYYDYSLQRNPTGPREGRNKVLRGGSWGNDWQDLRAANRSYNDPTQTSQYAGFRCVAASRE